MYAHVSPYFISHKEAKQITGFSPSQISKIFREIRLKYPNMHQQKGVVARDLFEKHLGIKNTYKGELN